MSKLRRNLYKAARILGDFEAVSKGKAGKRLERRIAGKMMGKSVKSAGCFIATAVYGNSSKEVEILRNFRDSYLVTVLYGRFFIKIYYLFSPYIADILNKYKILKKIVKFQINLILKFVSNITRKNIK